jgi:hypothetical protein
MMMGGGSEDDPVLELVRELVREPMTQLELVRIDEVA